MSTVGPPPTLSTAGPSTPPRPPELDTDEAPERNGAPTRVRRSRIVLAIALASGLVGAASGAHPTDLLVADLLVVGGMAGLVSWYSANARRWTWSWVAGVAGVAAVGSVLPLVLALGALVVALTATRAGRRHRIVGAVVGALAIQSLLRIGDLGPLGVPAMITAVGVIPVVLSGHRHMARRHRVRLRRAAIVLAVLAVLATISAGAVVLLVRDQLTGAVGRSEAAVSGVGAGRQDATTADLESARADFAAADDVLSSPLLWPARAVPFVGPHVGALGRLAEVGQDLTASASGSLQEVDYDRLRYESGRINLEEVEEVAPALRAIRSSLVEAEQGARGVDSPWLVAPLTHRVDELRDALIDTRRQADTAGVAVDLAPGMLGANGPRRYLVVFPTESETRGGGGFVGNFVILDAVDGEVRLTESSRIRTLIESRPPGERTLRNLEEYVAQYGDLRPQDFNQDLLYSPHFPSDADAFAQVAEQSLRGPIDTVISVSPSGLAGLMAFTGPIRIPGRAEPVRPGEAAQFLQLGQYLEYTDNEARADALEALTREAFDRLTSGSLPSPRALGAELGPLVPTGALRVWSMRGDEQVLLRRLGVTGELPAAGGHDLVHVSGVNGGQNKIDVFLRREVEVEPSLDPETGEVVSTVRVTLVNDAPTSGLPRYLIGNSQRDPVGTNRHQLSVFTPLMLESAKVDGVRVGVDAGQERGYQIFSRYVEVPPGESVVLEMRLRGPIPGMDGYRLIVPSQAMVNPDQLVVRGPLVGEERDLVLDRTRTVSGDG